MGVCIRAISGRHYAESIHTIFNCVRSIQARGGDLQFYNFFGFFMVVVIGMQVFARSGFLSKQQQHYDPSISYPAYRLCISRRRSVTSIVEEISAG